LTPDVLSPNGLLGFFKARGILLTFAPFPMDLGTLACQQAEVQTRTCLDVRLGTRAYLG